MTDARVKQITRLLKQAYGAPRWRPTHNPVDVLIRTILSQNTSDINSLPAFDKLKSAFTDWSEMEKADVSEIESLIKVSGLGHIKADRIKRALGVIKEKRGKVNLDFLSRMPIESARNWLKELPGVGDKTANCVLLFALGKPALPVDTHIYRVSRRLGLIPDLSTIGEAHNILGKMVTSKDVYAFHMLMITHGRKTCIARSPRCTECILGRICPSYEIFVGHSFRQLRKSGN